MDKTALHVREKYVFLNLIVNFKTLLALSWTTACQTCSSSLLSTFFLYLSLFSSFLLTQVISVASRTMWPRAIFLAFGFSRISFGIDKTLSYLILSLTVPLLQFQIYRILEENFKRVKVTTQIRVWCEVCVCTSVKWSLENCSVCPCLQ